MEIGPPAEQARAEIFQKELTALHVSVHVPADLGARTVGMSGRNLAMLASKVVAAAYPGDVQAQHIYAAVQSLRAAGNTQVDEEATWRTLILPRETEEKLRALCALLGNLEAWKARGVSIPTGLLLVGPPGVGKTQIARTLANESGLQHFTLTSMTSTNPISRLLLAGRPPLRTNRRALPKSKAN
ncbi:MAG: AAA family ATPase [Acidobacteriaceae bacterium]